MFSRKCQRKAFFIVKIFKDKGQDPKVPLDLTRVDGINTWLSKALLLDKEDCSIAKTNKEFLDMGYDEIEKKFEKLFLLSDLSNI